MIEIEDKKIFLKIAPTLNWGDSFNQFFIELVTGEKPETIDVRKKVNDRQTSYLVIGSTLQYADSNTVVWGAGFIKPGDICREKPQSVLAVRGPLTRQKLIDQEIDCPEIYGDPVLLAPKFYKPKTKKKYRLGIIPHIVDQDNSWFSQIDEQSDKVKIIDVYQTGFKFIDEVFECDLIASSSLHGLIIADAYSIPSSWLEFSDKVIGNGFKFQDYFASVSRKKQKSFRVTSKTTIADIISSFSKYKIKIDLDALWRSRPDSFK